MIRSRRIPDLYAGAAVGLLLLVSVLSGSIAAMAAVALLALGLVLFPDMRRRGFLAALTGAGAAMLLALVLRTLR